MLKDGHNMADTICSIMYGVLTISNWCSLNSAKLEGRENYIEKSLNIK